MSTPVRIWYGTPNYVGALCNGSTTDFDSVSLGSIPNAPANIMYESQKSDGAGKSLLKSEVW